MKAIEDHELLTINGGRQTVYYGFGGTGCPPLYKISSKLFKARKDGDKYRRRHPSRGRMTHNKYCIVL